MTCDTFYSELNLEVSLFWSKKKGKLRNTYNYVIFIILIATCIDNYQLDWISNTSVEQGDMCMFICLNRKYRSLLSGCYRQQAYFASVCRLLSSWPPFTVLVGRIQDFSIIFEHSPCLKLENKCCLKCYDIKGGGDDFFLFLPHYHEAVLLKVEFSSIPEMWPHSRVVSPSSEDRVCSTTEEPQFPGSVL